MSVPHQKRNSWLKYSGIAVGGAVLFAAVIFLFFKLADYDSTDSHRQGSCLKIYDKSEISKMSEMSEKTLLVERLNLNGADYSDIELWYDENGTSGDPDAWYSLIASAGSDEYRFTLYSLFEGDIDDWKVKKVFTRKKSQAVNVNGITVLTAPHTVTLGYPFFDYAIFEYEGVVYDLRVQSVRESTLMELLKEIIPNLDNE